MADFQININQVSALSREFSESSRRVKSIATEARSVLNQTRYSITVRIAQSLRSSATYSSISNCSTDLKNLSVGLEKAMNLYSRYENNISDKNLSIDDITDKAVAAANTASSASTSLGKTLLKLVESVGLAGASAGFLNQGYKAIKSGKWSDFLKTINSGYKTGSKWFKNYKNIKRFSNFKPSTGTIKTLWKNKIFGLDDYFKTNGIRLSTAKSASTRWYNNFQKIKANQLDDLTSTSGIIGTAASAIINGVSNYEEWKSGDISGGRAFAETVVETAVDVGVDLAVGVGVAAVAAACGGAPVVVVAGATMLINAGLNAATEALTGGEYDSFTELASDKIIDTATAVYDSAVNCYNKASKAISTAWKKLFK